MGSHLGQPGHLMPQGANEDWSIISRLAIASVTSQGTMGGLLVAGFVSTCFLKEYWPVLD